MGAKAFVLIETAVGKNRDILQTLKKTEGLTSVDYVTGPFDIIVVLEAGNLNEIGEIVTKKIHPIAGINRTTTCLSLKVS